MPRYGRDLSWGMVQYFIVHFKVLIFGRAMVGLGVMVGTMVRF